MNTNLWIGFWSCLILANLISMREGSTWGAGIYIVFAILFLIGTFFSKKP